MPGPASELYRSFCFHLQYDPQNSGHKTSFYRQFNEEALHLYQRAHWKWNNAKAWVYARGDVTTGTATFTRGSRVVTGVGTSWDVTHDEFWISPGTDPQEQEFVRVGRVASSTQVLLVDPYPSPTITTSYVMRQRYIPLPRDVLAYDGMVCHVNNFGPLAFCSSSEMDAYYMRPSEAGTPRAFGPASAPPWRPGATQPDTPITSPTLTQVAGGSLSALGTFRYKYTWVMNGVETGASPEAEITLTAGNQTVQVSNLEEVGALQGRYARLYRANAANGIFYRVGTNTTSDYTTTPVSDDGSQTDYTKPYNEGSQTQFVRVWPLTSENKLTMEVTYQALPRPIQKDSDYPDMPIDAQSAVLWATVASFARAMGKGGLAAAMQDRADKAVNQLLALGTHERPQTMVRRALSANRVGPVLLPPNTIRMT